MSNDLIKSVNLEDGNILEIYQMMDPQNPRDKDYDEGNIGIMAAFHTRYNLTDKDVPFTSADFDGWDEMEMHITKELRAIVSLPLYMYDHSGITIATKPFSCRWDSGRIGFIYTTAKRLSEVGVNIKNDEDFETYKQRIKEYLEAEVKTFDDYVTGNVYGFEIKDTEGAYVDGCSGFYGDDFKTNGILDNVNSKPINLDDL